MLMFCLLFICPVGTMGQRYLVIVADDFGYSTERDAGILGCHKEGAISATSLMVNGVSAKTAVEQAKKVSLWLGKFLIVYYMTFCYEVTHFKV